MAVKKFTKKQDANQSFMNQRRNIITEESSFNTQEAYKTLRTNLRFAVSREGCKRFCVTSGLAGEGKSITILNLAISFAQAGSRVLLIDGDMRRPNMARLLVENGAPGLSNILAKLCTAEQAVRKDVRPGMDVIFSGEIPPNPSELLSSRALEELLNEVESQYDYIFMDAPPVGLVSDACLVGNIVDGVLFVVRQNYSNSDVIREAIEQLNIAGVKITGFVFNGVEPESNRSSYYRSNYRKYRTYRYYRSQTGEQA